MKMPSVMRGSGRFARVPTADIPRSQFDRSHGLKTTFDAGVLVPIFVDEVLPGDTFNLKMTAFVRLSTPVKPIMDNLYLDTHFFFVPYRLIWSNFVKMCGEQEDPGDSTSFTVPQTTVPAAGYVAGRLEDYLGIPVGVANAVNGWSHSCLPIRAYFKIFNEWFRDQNLFDSRDNVGGAGSMSYGDGPDVAPAGGCYLEARGKRHDYFTSCLPWAQKETAVDVPLGSIIADGPFYLEGETSGEIGRVYPKTSTDPADAGLDSTSAAFTASETMDYYSGLAFDNPTINELREAFQIQKMLERDARGGTRYPEILMSHFKVQDPLMSVLQRPEYLGGGTAPIVVNAVAQTSETNTTEQGNLAGIGTAVADNHGFVKSFTEHGLVMGLASVRCDLTYQQGLERFWSRETRYDFYWPTLANLGEQAVLNKEIYLQDHADDDAAFGYQERWSEYRYKPSKITGEFRSNHANTLEIWHLAQDFAALPTLDWTFMAENVDMARILASSTNDHFLMDAYFKLICARPMPMYSVPGLIDHF